MTRGIANICGIPILCNVELVNMIWLLSKVVLHTQLFTMRPQLAPWALLYTKKGDAVDISFEGEVWGSNPRPSEPQSDALTN